MNKNIAMVVVVAVLLIGSVVLLANKNTTQAPTSTVPTNGQPVESPIPSEAKKENVKEFTVTGSNFSFDPKDLTVKKGDKVKITFKNADGFHDLVIDEFNVSTKTIPAGQSEAVEFTADKAGEFQYYCSVGNHRAMGMWGTLTVTE